MGSISVGGESDHVINISDVAVSMGQQMYKAPTLLSKAAGKSSCSIFRVSQNLVETSKEIYKPDIVSIGPYHHGEQRLAMIQEHKWQYLCLLIQRTKSNGRVLEDYLKAIHEREEDARKCYSEPIGLKSNQFIEMMMLDGAFIIELFRKVHNPKLIKVDEEPIFSMQYIYPSLARDFLKLENQIPFFILQILFDLSKMQGDEGTSLVMLTFKFSSHAFQRLEQVMVRGPNILEGKHLLDLIRSTFIPQAADHASNHDVDAFKTLKSVMKMGHNNLKGLINLWTGPARAADHPASNHDEDGKKQKVHPSQNHMIPCISNLRKSGVKIREGKADSFLTIKFRKGVIKMPSIIIDDFMPILLSNCVAFEQCHFHCSTHFTTYATLLDCLINTSKDVEYLSRHNIIVNYLGSDEEVANLINGLGKYVAFDIPSCYLSKLFKDVHDHSRHKLNLHWAGFKFTYFQTPWSFISALAALSVILLTGAQTFYTIYAYYHPRN